MLMELMEIFINIGNFYYLNIIINIAYKYFN